MKSLFVTDVNFVVYYENFCERNVRLAGVKLKICWDNLKDFATVFCKKASYNFIKNETLAHVFSWEFCEIFKNTFFYRRPPMAAYSGVLTVIIDVDLSLIYSRLELVGEYQLRKFKLFWTDIL